MNGLLSLRGSFEIASNLFNQDEFSISVEILVVAIKMLARWSGSVRVVSVAVQPIVNPLSARIFTDFGPRLLEGRVLHKGVWVATLLGVQDDVLDMTLHYISLLYFNINLIFYISYFCILYMYVIKLQNKILSTILNVKFLEN